MMRQCRECHRVRSVQRGNPAELCETCDAAIAEEVHRRVRVIQEALRLIKQEETLSAKLKHCDRMLKEAEALFGYEEREILTTCPPPSTLIQDFRAMRAALLRAG
jgi:hypothetical protein